MGIYNYFKPNNDRTAIFIFIFGQKNNMSPEERELLDRMFDTMPINEEMELETIFGENWNNITSNPRQFGKEVKNLVLEGQYPSIRHIYIHSNNHNTYIKS
jgi:hypothetical protein